MSQNLLYAIVLAAGKGTRMKSDLAKVLHPIQSEPMISHVLRAIEKLPLQQIVVVTGHQADRVEAAISRSNCVCVRQDRQLGTGHAVLVTEKLLGDRLGTALIICGDTPLVQSRTLVRMLSSHHAHNAKLTVMTTVLANPSHYGRIITGPDDAILAIVEEKDASEAELKINEVNAGIYCADLEFLYEALKQVGTENKQGEMYLTDIVGIARRQDIVVNRFLCPDALEVTGVNSQEELSLVENLLGAVINK